MTGHSLVYRKSIDSKFLLVGESDSTHKGSLNRQLVLPYVDALDLLCSKISTKLINGTVDLSNFKPF